MFHWQQNLTLKGYPKLNGNCKDILLQRHGNLMPVELLRFSCICIITTLTSHEDLGEKNIMEKSFCVLQPEQNGLH